MIDADKLLGMTRQEALNFLNKKNIIPVTDNLIKYKNTVYELDQLEIDSIFIYRDSKGYSLEYDGPEKKKGDARSINHMLLSAAFSFTNSIQNELEHNNLERKIVIQQIK